MLCVCVFCLNYEAYYIIFSFLFIDCDEGEVSLMKVLVSRSSTSVLSLQDHYKFYIEIIHFSLTMVLVPPYLFTYAIIPPIVGLRFWSLHSIFYLLPMLLVFILVSFLNPFQKKKKMYIETCVIISCTHYSVQQNILSSNFYSFIKLVFE